MTVNVLVLCEGGVPIAIGMHVTPPDAKPLRVAGVLRLLALDIFEIVFSSEIFKP